MGLRTYADKCDPPKETISEFKKEVIGMIDRELKWIEEDMTSLSNSISRDENTIAAEIMEDKYTDTGLGFGNINLRNAEITRDEKYIQLNQVSKWVRHMNKLKDWFIEYIIDDEGQ